MRDLAVANRVTRAHSPFLAWLKRRAGACAPSPDLSVLDVACGHGDLLRALWRQGRALGLRLSLQGIDLNPRSTSAAKAATPEAMGISFHTSDVFAYRPAPRPDFIVSSQFAHHLDDEAVVRLLRWIDEHAARGWYLCDLERHPIAFYGFPLLCRLAGWHAIVREDGALSVARAFRREDWASLLMRAGVAGKVRSHFPFRLGVEGGEVLERAPRRSPTGSASAPG